MWAKMGALFPIFTLQNPQWIDFKFPMNSSIPLGIWVGPAFLCRRDLFPFASHETSSYPYVSHHAVIFLPGTACTILLTLNIEHTQGNQSRVTSVFSLLTMTLLFFKISIRCNGSQSCNI